MWHVCWFIVLSTRLLWCTRHPNYCTGVKSTLPTNWGTTFLLLSPEFSEQASQWFKNLIENRIFATKCWRTCFHLCIKMYQKTGVTGLYFKWETPKKWWFYREYWVFIWGGTWPSPVQIQGNPSLDGFTAIHEQHLVVFLAAYWSQHHLFHL